MLAQVIDELRARRLVEEGQASAFEHVRRAGEFGEIEGERQLALEPRLDRMTVRRNDFDRIRGGERGNVAIDDVGHELPRLGARGDDANGDGTGNEYERRKGECRNPGTHPSKGS